MTNKEAFERFDQTHGARIESLFWMASHEIYENSDFKELIEYISDKEWKKLFPELFEKGKISEEMEFDQIVESLFDNNKLGFIAKTLHPICDSFRFEDGKPRSWSVKSWHCRISYVYAETTDELLAEIEKESDRIFEEFIKNDKEKHEKGI